MCSQLGINETEYYAHIQFQIKKDLILTEDTVSEKSCNLGNLHFKYAQLCDDIVNVVSFDVELFAKHPCVIVLFCAAELVIQTSTSLPGT